MIAGCKHRRIDQQPALIVKTVERPVRRGDFLADSDDGLFGLTPLFPLPLESGRCSLGSGSVAVILLHDPAAASSAAEVEILVVLPFLPGHNSRVVLQKTDSRISDVSDY